MALAAKIEAATFFVRKQPMNVLDAIQNRRSIRAFKPDPVPKATIEQILQIAQRAPSGTNTQPWHVYACAGAVKQAITDDVLALVRCGWGLYEALGIPKGDREASARQSARNFLFFDAPVGIFVTTDTYLGRGSWADAGMYLQTIMLAAKGFGLDTCPQAAWIQYQEPVFKHLGIPADQSLVSGMSLGFADPNAIENTLISEREALENVAHYRGFD